MEELPRDFTKMFDREVFKFDVELIPQAKVSNRRKVKRNMEYREMIERGREWKNIHENLELHRGRDGKRREGKSKWMGRKEKES